MQRNFRVAGTCKFSKEIPRFLPPNEVDFALLESSGRGEMREAIALQIPAPYLLPSGAFLPPCTLTITAKVRKTCACVRALMAQTWILQEVVPALSTWLKILMMSPAPTGAV